VGGPIGAATGTNNSTGGGTGGTGSGGDINVDGDAGGIGQVISAIPIKLNNGGGSVLGGMQRSSATVNTQTAGLAGATYGGGASGSSNGASQTATAA
jgi:hypothetical protein